MIRIPPIQTLLEAWTRGCACFEQAQWYEAHHEWELAWNLHPSPDRENIQALIMACGALVHLSQGRVDPARVLAQKSVDRLSAIEHGRASYSLKAWIEIPGLRVQLQALIDELARVGVHPSIAFDSASLLAPFRGLRCRIKTALDNGPEAGDKAGDAVP